MEGCVVYAVRHVESKWNTASAEERKISTSLWESSPGVYNPLQDADVSPAGDKQLAELPNRIPAGIQRIYCSPLTRSIKTAIAASGAGSATASVVPICVKASLREVRRDVGDLGSSPAEIKKKFPSVSGIDDLGDSWWREPGCDCKELEECEKCVTGRLQQVRALLTSEKSSSILIVSHFDLIDALCGKKLNNGEMVRL